jgi:hypothetical protein
MPVFSIHSRCNRLALRTAGFFTLCCDEEFGYKSCQTVIGAARAFLVQCLGELYQRGNDSAPLAVCSFSTRFAARSSPTTVIKNNHVMQQVNMPVQRTSPNYAVHTLTRLHRRVRIWCTWYCRQHSKFETGI